MKAATVPEATNLFAQHAPFVVLYIFAAYSYIFIDQATKDIYYNKVDKSMIYLAYFSFRVSCDISCLIFCCST